MLEQWLERLIIQRLKAMQVEVSYFEFVESLRHERENKSLDKAW